MQDTDFFWEGAKQGRLLAQRCSDCGQLRQPPGPMCPRCQSLAWAPQELSGRGRVYTWLLSKHPTQPDTAPRIVVLVQLEEGIRLVSNIQGIDVNKIRPDMPVEVFFETIGGHVLPQFRPVRESV